MAKLGEPAWHFLVVWDSLDGCFLNYANSINIPPYHMMKPSNILFVATKYLSKVAQTVSAQPSDIDNALSAAHAKPSANDIAPLLNTAKVPDNVSLTIQIAVDPKLNVAFIVAANPTSNSANVLKALLDRKYAAAMKAALQKAGLAISGKMVVNIATFAA